MLHILQRKHLEGTGKLLYSPFQTAELCAYSVLFDEVFSPVESSFPPFWSATLGAMSGISEALRFLFVSQSNLFPETPDCFGDLALSTTCRVGRKKMAVARQGY